MLPRAFSIPVATVFMYENTEPGWSSTVTDTAWEEESMILCARTERIPAVSEDMSREPLAGL